MKSFATPNSYFKDAVESYFSKLFVKERFKDSTASLNMLDLLQVKKCWNTKFVNTQQPLLISEFNSYFSWIGKGLELEVSGNIREADFDFTKIFLTLFLEDLRKIKKIILTVNPNYWNWIILGINKVTLTHNSENLMKSGSSMEELGCIKISYPHDLSGIIEMLIHESSHQHFYKIVMVKKNKRQNSHYSFNF